MTRATIVVSVLLAAVALRIGHADVWQSAITRGKPDPARDEYELQMKNGDELAVLATPRSLNRKQIITYVDRAVAAYRAASHAKPDEAEPYFRIGTLLEVFFHDCSAELGPARASCEPEDPQRWRDVVEAWDAFEARAPLDPRLTDLLFTRAIIRTKLSSDPRTSHADLDAAARDYRAILDRSDGLNRGSRHQVLGNLAETYMMLDQLELAIDTYQLACRAGADASTAYGLAVALDRDESEAQAFAVIREQGREGFEQFERMFQEGRVFFVPRGEEFYYFALINEAFGNQQNAIANWRLFLSSGAHPQFQRRAKAHLDALLARPRTMSRPLLPDDLFERLR